MANSSMSLCVATGSEDELTSKPTADKSDEMLLTLANGIRPNLIVPSVAGDPPAGVAVVSAETPFTSAVCKLRHPRLALAVLNYT